MTDTIPYPSGFEGPVLGLTAAEKLVINKQKMREAQHRFYEKHKHELREKSKEYMKNKAIVSLSQHEKPIIGLTLRKDSIQGLTAEEQLERRKQQLREAQHRFYEKNKDKDKDNKIKGTKEEIPKSYNIEHIKAYHKAYYQKKKEIILTKSKDKYESRKIPISHDPQAMREYQKAYYQNIRKISFKINQPKSKYS